MGKAARNAGYTKEYNRKMFIRLLRREPLSRAEIARRMGLTRAATSLIADELLSENLIVETAATTHQLGRTPVPLALRPEAGYAVGVYLNRDGCVAGLVDICGNVLSQRRLHIGGGVEGEKVAPLVRAIGEMIGGAHIPQNRIVGIGVSAPGPLDGERGRILNPPKFTLWHQTDIGPMLQNAFDLPTYLENDASCLARYNLGKPEAMGSENFLLLLVDSGIGSGVISNGKVLKGAGYFTSELGHTSINFQGRRCACGNIGCLEAYAAIGNLLQGSEFTVWKQIMDCYDVSEKAHRLLLQEIEYLTAGIVNMTNLVSIDTVLLAGDLLYGADRLAPLLEENVNNRMLRRDSIPIRVLPSCSGPNAQIQAAADVAFGRFLMV